MRKAYILFILLLSACTGNYDNRYEPTRSSQTDKSENSVSGKVVGISDGDTFKLLVEGNKTIRVRLHGIDAPERKQDFGTVARQKLSDLIFGGQVRVIQKDIDRYGRTIGIVYNSQNQCVNEEMLKSGLAWHYKEYDKNPEWNDMEQKARNKQIGLWSHPNPVAPWQWRKQQRESKVEL